MTGWMEWRFILLRTVHEPEEYSVCALADHQTGSEMDPDHLRSLKRDSERINPSPGQTVQESLVALSAPKMN